MKNSIVIVKRFFHFSAILIFNRFDYFFPAWMGSFEINLRVFRWFPVREVSGKRHDSNVEFRDRRPLVFLPKFLRVGTRPTLPGFEHNQPVTLPEHVEDSHFPRRGIHGVSFRVFIIRPAHGDFAPVPFIAGVVRDHRDERTIRRKISRPVTWRFVTSSENHQSRSKWNDKHQQGFSSSHLNRLLNYKPLWDHLTQGGQPPFFGIFSPLSFFSHFRFCNFITNHQ
ncbi:MAG: hypothetical protein AB1742_00730 [bacterium]